MTKAVNPTTTSAGSSHHRSRRSVGRPRTFAIVAMAPPPCQSGTVRRWLSEDKYMNRVNSIALRYGRADRPAPLLPGGRRAGPFHAGGARAGDRAALGERAGAPPRG